MPAFENEFEEEETEQDKILTLEDFKKQALAKLEMKNKQPGKQKKSQSKSRRK